MTRLATRSALICGHEEIRTTQISAECGQAKRQAMCRCVSTCDVRRATCDVRHIYIYIKSSRVESHCVSLLTYAIEIVHVADRDERRQLRVAYNSLFRKIFGYRRTQSVTALQHFVGRLTWEELVLKRVENFRHRLTLCPPETLARIVQ